MNRRNMLKSSLAGAVGALSVPSLLAGEPDMLEEFEPFSVDPILYDTTTEEIRCSTGLTLSDSRKVVLRTEKDGDPRYELEGLAYRVSLDSQHSIYKYSRSSGEVSYYNPGFPSDCAITLHNFCCPKILLDSWLRYAADVSVPVSVRIYPGEESGVVGTSLLDYVRDNWLSRLVSISCISVDSGVSVVNDLRFECRVQQPFPPST